MTRYRNKTWFEKTISILPWLFVAGAFVFLYIQFRSVRLMVDTHPPEIYGPVQQTQKDPCMELRNQEDYLNKRIAHLQQKMAMFQANIALEIELSKDGKVPISKLASLLREHDFTNTGMYKRLYKVPDKKKN